MISLPIVRFKIERLKDYQRVDSCMCCACKQDINLDGLEMLFGQIEVDNIVVFSEYICSSCQSFKFPYSWTTFGKPSNAEFLRLEARCTRI